MKYNRGEFIKTAGMAMASLGATGAVGGAEKKTRRNVILYVVDDQGSTDAGCYGNPVIKTPGLDQLAADGVRFTNAFCTTASCSASRSVILTGLQNHANGQYGHQHSYHHFRSFDNIVSLPVHLENAGYRTARIGKYHVAPEEVYRFQTTLRGGSPEQKAENCREYIGSDDDKPFFLYFCTNEPHRPFRREGSDTFSPDDVIVPPYLPDSPECREELAQYYGSVQRADKGLLRLIEILKETGHYDDTLVIYISDNGIAFPGAKTNLYDPGMRLPCVVRDPYGGKEGFVTDAMISYVDLTPTILDYVGVPPEKNPTHGRSFLQAMREKQPAGWDEVYASHTFHEITMYYPMRVVRTRDHKLIWNIAHGLEYPFASDLHASKTWQGLLKRGEKYYGKRPVEAYLRRPEFELYDLKADPLEVNNLAEDSASADILSRLKTKLKAFQKETGDPWILKWNYE